MNCADPRASQQGNGQLWSHAHVDGHAVALADAQRLERIGKSLHFNMQLGVSQPPHLARFTLPNQRGFVAALAQCMAIHAVIA